VIGPPKYGWKSAMRSIGLAVVMPFAFSSGVTLFPCILPGWYMKVVPPWNSDPPDLVIMFM